MPIDVRDLINKERAWKSSTSEPERAVKLRAEILTIISRTLQEVVFPAVEHVHGEFQGDGRLTFRKCRAANCEGHFFNGVVLDFSEGERKHTFEVSSIECAPPSFEVRDSTAHAALTMPVTSMDRAAFDSLLLAFLRRALRLGLND